MIEHLITHIQHHTLTHDYVPGRLKIRVRWFWNVWCARSVPHGTDSYCHSSNLAVNRSISRLESDKTALKWESISLTCGKPRWRLVYLSGQLTVSIIHLLALFVKSIRTDFSRPSRTNRQTRLVVVYLTRNIGKRWPVRLVGQWDKQGLSLPCSESKLSFLLSCLFLIRSRTGDVHRYLLECGVANNEI